MKRYEWLLNWKVVFGLIVSMIVLPFVITKLLVPPEFRRALGFSFVNGEASVLLWTQGGVSRPLAILIAMGCGTYDFLFYNVLFRFVKRLFQGNHRTHYERFGNYVKGSGWSVLIRGKDIGEKIYHSLVPRRDKIFLLGASRIPNPNDPRFYVPLLYYGGAPGGILTGIFYAIAFCLNLALAILVEGCANMAKIAGFGTCGSLVAKRFPVIALHPWLVTAVFMAGLPFLKRYFERWLRSTA